MTYHLRVAWPGAPGEAMNMIDSFGDIAAVLIIFNVILIGLLVHVIRKTFDD